MTINILIIKGFDILKSQSVFIWFCDFLQYFGEDHMIGIQTKMKQRKKSRKSSALFVVDSMSS